MNRIAKIQNGTQQRDSTPVSIEYVDDETIEIVADVSEYNTDDVDVSLNGDSITVSASTFEEEANDNQTSVQRRSFSQTVKLPQQITRDTVDATVTNGLLVVTCRVEDTGEDTTSVTIREE